jgi:hypothetical protein
VHPPGGQNFGERFEPEVVELERTARSAADAADALGVRVEQIVKSLVFRGRRTGYPVLVLAGGANRVDEGRISCLLSEPVEMADACLRAREDRLRHRRGAARGTRRASRGVRGRGPVGGERSGPPPGTRT